MVNTCPTKKGIAFSPIINKTSSRGYLRSPMKKLIGMNLSKENIYERHNKKSFR